MTNNNGLDNVTGASKAKEHTKKSVPEQVASALITAYVFGFFAAIPSALMYKLVAYIVGM